MTDSRQPLAAKSTARRVGQILKLFVEVRGDWGVTEVGTELGCSKAVAFRALAALAQEGILDRDPSTRRYALGPALLKVRPFTRNQARVAQQAWPYLDNITRRSGETAILSMLQGRRRIHVQQTPSTRTIQITVPIGVPEDLHQTASGLAMLAFMTPDERWAAVGDARARAARNDGDIEAVELHDRLAAVRRRGFAVHQNEHSGTTGVAAPVRDQVGSIIGALGIIALNVDVEATRVGEYGVIVREEANRFSRRLRA